MANNESASGGVQSSHNSDASSAAAGASAPHRAGDQPFFDPVAYGNGPDDSVSDSSENAAITRHSISIGGKKIDYTATAGHLVTVDPSSSQPNAKMFYVAFTQDGQVNQTCLMTAPTKKTAAIASRIKPSRLLPARICSGVRLSCEFRVMLNFWTLS